MATNFWKNKNVFITGVNGFVGSNLAEDLVNKGANVYGLIRNINPKSYLFFNKINSRINIVNGSLVDKELLHGFFIENKIDICFHLAAQVEVGVAAKYPFLTWETNVRGTYTLLEVIRETSPDISSIVIASSDKAYGEYPIDMLPYKEDYALKPNYPYDTSKACSDIIAQSYSSDLFKMPIVITRFSNIYGPGQLNFSAVIPDAIRSALGYSRFIPRGNGRSKRDFLYVKDVADLYRLIAKNLYKDSKIAGEIFNAGTKEEKSIKDVITNIFNTLNNEKDLVEILNLFEKNFSTQGEINTQLMDYDKVYKYFGWKPKTSFIKGIIKTIDWYKKYLANE